MTTNPSIFSAAIKGSALYKDDILELSAKGLDATSIVNVLTTDDVSKACDLFSETFERTSGIDGRVSIEVDPFFAHETTKTVEQGRSLWKEISKPNLLIKVPATDAGLPAIRTLTSEGISVNVTLIFSVKRYEQVMEAYISGLEDRLKAGLPLAGIHSVASFFVSRIDTEIDKRLDAITPNSPLRGKSAIANAVLAYEAYLKVVQSDRWKTLSEKGAAVQRPLWASTGVKDKSYDATRYVVELVATNCVNTMPEGTLDAVRDHGVVRGDSISPEISASHQHFIDLKNAGIDFEDVVQHLEVDGVKKFADAWKELLDNVRAVA